ncbi:hypothetical protein [Thermophilibacter sp.]
MRAWVAALRGREGQMTVELAVLTPVVIVIALVALNLMGYVEACAAFDQAAQDAVLAHGVAPSGEQSSERAVEEVSSALAEALGREGRCEVEVRAEGVSEGGRQTSFAVSPLLTRYVCTLTYRPWPRLARLPGVTFEAPLALRHEREIVVDRYRSGVVV